MGLFFFCALLMVVNLFALAFGTIAFIPGCGSAFQRGLWGKIHKFDGINRGALHPPVFVHQLDGSRETEGGFREEEYIERQLVSCNIDNPIGWRCSYCFCASVVMCLQRGR